MRNQKGGAWASESENEGEIVMLENLVRYGVTVSKSDSGQKESVP